MKAVREKEVKLRGVGFVKVGFNPRVKEREGVMDEQSGESPITSFSFDYSRTMPKGLYFTAVVSFCLSSLF